MASRCRVDERHGELTSVPSLNAPGIIQKGERYVEFMESVLDSLQIVLEPVGYQDRFPIGCLDQIFQSV